MNRFERQAYHIARAKQTRHRETISPKETGSVEEALASSDKALISLGMKEKPLMKSLVQRFEPNILKEPFQIEAECREYNSLLIKAGQERVEWSNNWSARLKEISRKSDAAFDNYRNRNTPEAKAWRHERDGNREIRVEPYFGQPISKGTHNIEAVTLKQKELVDYQVNRALINAATYNNREKGLIVGAIKEFPLDILIRESMENYLPSHLIGYSQTVSQLSQIPGYERHKDPIQYHQPGRARVFSVERRAKVHSVKRKNGKELDPKVEQAIKDIFNDTSDVDVPTPIRDDQGRHLIQGDVQMRPFRAGLNRP
jgi:hypothetical protein